jgi:hypothetical protein
MKRKTCLPGPSPRPLSSEGHNLQNSKMSGLTDHITRSSRSSSAADAVTGHGVPCSAEWQRKNCLLNEAFGVLQSLEVIMDTKLLTNIGLRQLESVLVKAGRKAAVCAALAAGVVLVPGVALSHDVVLNIASTADVACTSAANWTTVRSVTLPAIAHAHGCAITAQADLVNPGSDTADQQYHVTVSMDNANPFVDGAGEVTVELRDQPGVNDPNAWPVSTTLG